MITPEDAFDLLCDERRCHVLYAIRDTDSIELADLAAAVAARDRNAEEGNVPAHRLHDIVVSLHHVELPKLEDAGVIEYDVRQQEIHKGPLFASLIPYLEHTHNDH